MTTTNNLNIKAFAFIELKNGQSFLYNENLFLAQNQKTEIFFLFEIQNNINILLKSFRYENIKQIF